MFLSLFKPEVISDMLTYIVQLSLKIRITTAIQGCRQIKYIRERTRQKTLSRLLLSWLHGNGRQDFARKGWKISQKSVLRSLLFWNSNIFGWTMFSRSFKTTFCGKMDSYIFYLIAVSKESKWLDMYSTLFTSRRHSSMLRFELFFCAYTRKRHCIYIRKFI